MWTALEKVIYQFGVVESFGSISITALYMGYLTIAYIYLKARLFAVLWLLGMSVIAWTVVYDGQDAYLFKAVKNGIFLAGIASVWVNYLCRSWVLPLRWQHFLFWRGK